MAPAFPALLRGNRPRGGEKGERLGSWEIAQSLERMEQRARSLGAGGKGAMSSEERRLRAASKGDRSRKQGG